MTSAVMWLYAVIINDSDSLFLFKGLAPNGMTLAPICGLVIIHLLFYAPRQAIYIKWSLLTAALIVSLMMITAASRIAIIALLVAIIPLIIVNRGTIIKYKRNIFLISTVLIAIIAVSPVITKGVISKTQYALTQGSLSYSRDAKWQNRLDEFISSPFVGIGYTVQTKFNTDTENENSIMISGQTEPGSAWLGILAQIGIIGFTTIAVFNYKLCRNLLLLIKAHVTGSWILYFSWILFLLTHGIAEGWMLYPGSVIFFIYWLLTGIISGSIKKYDIVHQ